LRRSFAGRLPGYGVVGRHVDVRNLIPRRAHGAYGNPGLRLSGTPAAHVDARVSP
jgi:hypothetical protein